MTFPNCFVCGCPQKSTYTSPVPAPLFRKEFLWNKENKATLLIGATGLYMLYVNGKDITKGQLAPFFSNSNDIVYYDEYDLTPYLESGENVLCILLGNGTANPIGGEIWGHTQIAKVPSFALRYQSGETTFDAKDMLWTPSHILFDDLRCGVFCDRRLEHPSWYKKGIPEGIWSPATPVETPSGKPYLTTCEPVTIQKTLLAKKIISGSLREYRIRDVYADRLTNHCPLMGTSPLYGGVIFDFGENYAGVPILKIKGDAGQRIELQFSELLFEGAVDYTNVDVYPDGCCQRDVYILKGEGEETFIPPFTYHGARYCYVYGLKEEQITQSTLSFGVLHNNVIQKSSFECSTKIANQIYDACIRSDKSNLLYILTDCPQREKNGWTGDAAISADQYLTHFGVEKCLKDWMVSIRESQFSDGTFPLIVPSKNDYDPCLIWDSALLELTYQIYRHTLSIDVIQENLMYILKNLHEWYEKRDEEGIIEVGLGDWLPPDTLPSVYDSPLGLCCSAVFLDECAKAEELCRVVGDTKNEKWCQSVVGEFKINIRKAYDGGPGLLSPRKKDILENKGYKPCQTSQVLGLAFDIFEDSEKDLARQNLVRMIHEKNDSFDTGFLGLRYIFDVLLEANELDLAWKMITKTEHPSYANQIFRGETTICERFSAPGLRIGSHNHHFMADVSRFFIQSILGIKPIEKNGILSYSIHPNLPSELSYATGYSIIGNKKIEVTVFRKDNKVDYSVQES